MKKLLFLSLICFLSCSSEPQFETSQLVGTWDGIAWNDLTNNKQIDVQVGFIFESDSSYVGSYGNSKELGQFWIEGENLHTIEDGKAEKKVKIKKLQNDTLVFGMNRAGTLEEIILVKKK